jgi:hypothetical protein
LEYKYRFAGNDKAYFGPELSKQIKSWKVIAPRGGILNPEYSTIQKYPRYNNSLDTRSLDCCAISEIVFGDFVNGNLTKHFVKGSWVLQLTESYSKEQVRQFPRFP